MKRTYFGTDGIRGPYGGPVINEQFAARLGLAVARWAGGRGRALIGRDTRGSGESLARALAAGLVAGGMEPVLLGVVPTPAVARAVRKRGAELGVVVTASHNPAADNGIKFFAAGGLKLPDEDEARIEALLPPEGLAIPAVEVVSCDGAGNDYVEAACGLLPAGALQGWRVVLDTANGATCRTSPAVLRTLGAELRAIGDAPDGANINSGVGSEHPEALAAAVVSAGAHIGIAHDGDGDRCVLCDECGSVLDGDEILAILATHALAKGTLAQRLLVITQQSNLGVDVAVGAAGGRVVRTPIGDRYVIERMRAEGALLGGESSGHIVRMDISTTGDGLVAALGVVGVMLETGRTLSELRAVLSKFPQSTRNLKVREKRPLANLPAMQAAIAEIEAAFGTQGRVLVRYSGTEPKLRLLVEAANDGLVCSGLARLEEAARESLEVI